MIIIDAKIEIKSEGIEIAKEAFIRLVNASRKINGVLAYDIAQDVTNDSIFIATEVYDDDEARAKTEEIPEFKRMLEVIRPIRVEPPSGTVFHVDKGTPLQYE